MIGEQELAGAVGALGIEPGPLATTQLGAATEHATRLFEDALVSLADEGRDLLETAVTSLANPARMVDFAAIGADEGVYRAVFAWGAGDEIALLSGAGNAMQLGMASSDDILAQITGPLRPDGAILGADERIELDGRAVVALLAAADALRLARMSALATHGATPDAITAADVAAVLADSAAGDPRWATGLLAGVLPFDAASFMDAPTIALAFTRLAEAGVVAITEAEAGAPALYRPTEHGWVLFDTLLQADARVAVTVYQMTEAGEVAYESMLFARGAGTMLVFSVAPTGGGVATLTAQGFARVAGSIAGE